MGGAPQSFTFLAVIAPEVARAVPISRERSLQEQAQRHWAPLIPGRGTPLHDHPPQPASNGDVNGNNFDEVTYQPEPGNGFDCWPLPQPSVAFGLQGPGIAYKGQKTQLTVYPACPGAQALWVPDLDCPYLCETMPVPTRNAAPCLDNELKATFVFKRKTIYRLCLRSPACPEPPCPWMRTNVTLSVAPCPAPSTPPRPPLPPSPPPCSRFDRRMMTLSAPVEAGSTQLPVLTHGCGIGKGDMLVIAEGQSNEEVITVARLGSIVALQPLRFNHFLGESVQLLPSQPSPPPSSPSDVPTPTPTPSASFGAVHLPNVSVIPTATPLADSQISSQQMEQHNDVAFTFVGDEDAGDAPKSNHRRHQLSPHQVGSLHRLPMTMSFHA